MTTKTPFKTLTNEIKSKEVRSALSKTAIWYAVKNWEPIGNKELEQAAYEQGKRFEAQGRKEEAAESYYLSMLACSKRIEETGGMFGMTSIVSILRKSFNLYSEAGNAEGMINSGRLLVESKISPGDDLTIYADATKMLNMTVELAKASAALQGKEALIEKCEKMIKEFSLWHDTELLREVKSMVLREKITSLNDAELILTNGIVNPQRKEQALVLIRQQWNAMHWLD